MPLPGHPRPRGTGPAALIPADGVLEGLLAFQLVNASNLTGVCAYRNFTQVIIFANSMRLWSRVFFLKKISIMLGLMPFIIRCTIHRKQCVFKSDFFSTQKP
uniref:Secreted protein n=1 Tax=Echinococcus granulosus TaxID=6210 RepID=A0A068X4Z2_ECHGR|nr:hypothetical protein EgrG_000395900 [Echinococcus granulosus]